MTDSSTTTGNPESDGNTAGKKSSVWLVLLSITSLIAVVFAIVSVKQVQGVKKQQYNIEKERDSAQETLDHAREQLEYFNYQVRRSMKQHAPLAEQIEYNQRLDQLGLLLATPADENTDSRVVKWHEEISRADSILTKGEQHPSSTTGIYELTERIAKRLYERDQSNKEYQRMLSVSHERVGDIKHRLGNLEAAFESYEASLLIAEKLVEQSPEKFEYQRHLSISYAKLGNLHLHKGESQLALESYDKAIAIKKQLIASKPDDITLKRDLAVSHNQIGASESKLGNVDKATQSYKTALSISQSLIELEPQSAEYQRDLFVSYWKLYSLARKEKKLAEANNYIQLAEQQLSLMDSLGILSANDWTYLNNAKMIKSSLRNM